MHNTETNIFFVIKWNHYYMDNRELFDDNLKKAERFKDYDTAKINLPNKFCRIAKITEFIDTQEFLYTF